MTEILNDRQLAKQFEAIFTRYFSPVKYFAFLLLKSWEDAEDIAQDVFAKLWTQPQIWATNTHIDGYIFAMTKHSTINFIKHKKIVQGYQEKVIEKSRINELSNAEDPFDPIYYKEVMMIIKLTLDRQPKRRKRIFEMSRFQYMSNNEIAETLRISVRTVEQQIYRTLIELRKTILFLLFFFLL